MQYSCGYFEDDRTTLDEAQPAKMQHIAAKLRLSPGQRVLDIGSGWGGLADFLSQVYDVRTTGITLSNNRRSTSEKKKRSNNVEFHLRDYRSERGTYDRIVSVGMLEHEDVRIIQGFFGN